jgi:hypothetical protein
MYDVSIRHGEFGYVSEERVHCRGLAGPVQPRGHRPLTVDESTPPLRKTPTPRAASAPSASHRRFEEMGELFCVFFGSRMLDARVGIEVPVPADAKPGVRDEQQVRRRQPLDAQPGCFFDCDATTRVDVYATDAFR